jgi:hypothetical protein
MGHMSGIKFRKTQELRHLIIRFVRSFLPRPFHLAIIVLKLW